MNPIRRQKLLTLLILLFVLAAVTFLVLYALRQNINLFYTPSDAVQGKILPESHIRLGGMVTEGSVRRSSKNLSVSFLLSDYKHSITVQYEGILPDLFREGQGIVTMGVLNKNGVFIASEVLAKHDENYMPQALKERLANNAKGSET